MPNDISFRTVNTSTARKNCTLHKKMRKMSHYEQMRGWIEDYDDMNFLSSAMLTI